MRDLILTGPVGSRPHLLAKTCEESVGHQHNYDHVTIVVLGGIKVTIRVTPGGPIESEQEYYPGSDPVFIAAHKFHTIKALADNTMYHCIFSHRDFGGLVTQTYSGNIHSYQ